MPLVIDRHGDAVVPQVDPSSPLFSTAMVPPSAVTGGRHKARARRNRIRMAAPPTRLVPEFGKSGGRLFLAAHRAELSTLLFVRRMRQERDEDCGELFRLLEV